MEASAPDASLPIASDALLIAPHPREPDNVLFGLCARCKHRMTERMRVVTDDSASELGARPEETDGARIRDLWWADLRRIRGIRSQTVAGALAKYQIARSVYEWSSGLDLTLGEFLVEASDELEFHLDEAFQAEIQKFQVNPQLERQPGLLTKLLSMF